MSPRPYVPNRIFSDKELFSEIDRIWQKVGQRPSRTEWENSNPKIAYNTYKRRFGSWTSACLKFIEYKMGKEILLDDFVPTDGKKQKDSKKARIVYKKESSRNISLSLRLKILNRDNFRCVLCGRSPVTDFGVKLHIDHVNPFSKGGKSVIENLQTLCQDCNLGKSNKIIVNN